MSKQGDAKAVSDAPVGDDFDDFLVLLDIGVQRRTLVDDGGEAALEGAAIDHATRGGRGIAEDLQDLVHRQRRDCEHACMYSHGLSAS